MNVKAGDIAVVIGGSAPQYRPEDIGKQCKVLFWVEPMGTIDVPGYEKDRNHCGEAAWAVEIYAEDIQGLGIAMKRDAWLMPLKGDPPAVSIVERKRVLEDDLVIS